MARDRDAGLRERGFVQGALGMLVAAQYQQRRVRHGRADRRPGRAQEREDAVVVGPVAKRPMNSSPWDAEGRYVPVSIRRAVADALDPRWSTSCPSSREQTITPS